MAAQGPAPDVAVIGGGIVGTALAVFLAEGGLRVRLHEASAIAAGASGRNSGIVQHPFDPILAGLYRETVTEYRRLAAATDGSFRLDVEPAGLLYVGRDPATAARTAAEWAAAWPDAHAEVIDGAALARLEPALAPDLVACRLDVGYPVAPSSATDAFAVLAGRLGVEVVIGGGPTHPAIAGDRVVGVERGGSIEPAGAVVVAAGPWTPEVVDATGRWRPIGRSWGVVASVAVPGAPRHGLEAADIEIEPAEPVGGDTVAEVGPTKPTDPAVPGSGDPRDGAVDFSLVPSSGSSALGSTFLPDEPDPREWLDALRRVGGRYVPAIATAPVIAWRCCARPVSRDGRPLVGPASWAAGLWIAAGHGPWGISTGPGSARVLADRILAGPHAGMAAGGIPAELDVGRFGTP
jgi:glycine/D-amino acid oxidase-like deaminating enzyme